MKSMSVLKLAASGLVLATGFSIGNGSGTAVQAAVDSSGSLASAARKVESLLAKKKTDKAVAEAERLVAARPDNASFRMLLGQAYLQAGRFRAASTSFSDVMRLSPGHDRAALNYALTQIALGQNDAALSVLEEHRDILKGADYGLALALAGQPAEAVNILQAAARGADATPRTRQNLAMAHALNGQWIEARTVMAQDLSPDLVDARIVEWASFVRPKAAWDQVASLMKVTPVYDPGQPTALALNTDTQLVRVAAAEPVPVPVAAPAPEPIPAVEQAAPAAAFEVAETVTGNTVTVALDDPAPPQAGISEEPAQQVASSGVVFGPRQEVVQATAVRTAPLIRAHAAPAKQKLSQATTAATPRQVITTSDAGRFVVQLGAYSSPKAAERAWNRNAKRFGLAERDPHQASIKIRSTTLYRLSVAGYTNRADATRICGQVRSEGGNCFVRRVAGEAVPMWARRSPVGKERLQLAQR